MPRKVKFPKSIFIQKKFDDASPYYLAWETAEESDDDELVAKYELKNVKKQLNI